MKDLYLKFDHQQQAERTLLQAGFLPDESGAVYHPEVCTDVIGVIYTPVNPDAEAPDYQPEPGWHINLRVVGELSTDAFAPFVVNPDTPARVWA